MSEKNKENVETISQDNSFCRYKAVPRDEETVKTIQGRLNRVIGQLGGVKKMIDDNRYCGDLLVQIAAAESALQNVGYMILKEHMETCLVDGIKNGDTELLDEATELIKRFCEFC